MIRILTITAVFGFTAPAFAADEIPWFEVELIVFKYSGADSPLGQERWPADPGIPQLRDAVELIAAPATPGDKGGDLPDPPVGRPDLPGIPPPAASSPAPPRVLETLKIKLHPEPFQRLPENALRLDTAYQRLVRSQAYEPLVHIGWLQPAVAGDGANPVHVYTGMTEQPDTDDAEPGVAERKPGAGEAMTTGPTEALLELPMEFRTVDGIVRLSLSRYLHLAVDLVYRPEGMWKVEPIDRVADLLIPTDGSAPIAAAPAVFRLAESRRMRSQEIHYFDHPAFGVIALVTPYEPPVLELRIPPPEVSSSENSAREGSPGPARSTGTSPALQ